jgi:hypothetical protein
LSRLIQLVTKSKRVTSEIVTRSDQLSRPPASLGWASFEGFAISEAKWDVSRTVVKFFDIQICSNSISEAKTFQTGD